MRFFVCPCFVDLHLLKYALILDFHNLMFHISIFARLEFIFVGLEIIHTLLRLGSLRVADYAESLLAEPFILVEILLLALMYDYDCENDWDYDQHYNYN